MVFTFDIRSGYDSLRLQNIMTKEVRWDSETNLTYNSTHKDSKLICGFGGTQNDIGSLRGF
jgi:hypothetical protein